MSNQSEDTNEVIIYAGSDGRTRVQMRFTGRDVWMTQAQIAELLAVDVRTISYHLTNIFKEGELESGSVIQEIWITARDSKQYPTSHYNLDAIISVGYRVSSKQATKFRQWATRILTEFAVKGHVVDVERLKDPAAADYFQELLEKIRDIRSSEQHVWKRVLELAALCNDYAAASREQVEQF